jgi:hypothetical protein
MCAVPSMAVFCRESIEYCPGIVSRYFCIIVVVVIIIISCHGFSFLPGASPLEPVVNPTTYYYYYYYYNYIILM